MNLITYFLIFFTICVIWFFVTRIWVNGIDLIVSALKKFFRLNKGDSVEKWHTLENIRNERKED